MPCPCAFEDRGKAGPHIYFSQASPHRDRELRSHRRGAMARRGGRWTARAGAALLGLGLTLGLAGCLGVPDAPRPAARAVPEGEPSPTVTAGNVIGAGTVKVAL